MSSVADILVGSGQVAIGAGMQAAAADPYGAAMLNVAGLLALPMCRRDIGDYLGLTLETVSRALSQLQSQGILGFSGARQIELRNRARLRNLDA